MKYTQAWYLIEHANLFSVFDVMATGTRHFNAQTRKLADIVQMNTVQKLVLEICLQDVGVMGPIRSTCNYLHILSAAVSGR